MNGIDKVPDVIQDDDGPEGNLCSEDACAEYRLELEDRVKELRAANESRQRSIEILGKAIGEAIPNFRASGTGEEHSTKVAAAFLDNETRLVELLRKARPHLQREARDAAAVKRYDREIHERRAALMKLLIDIHFTIDEGSSLGSNQPCVVCGAEDGTFSERGFPRCSACGFPGQ